MESISLLDRLYGSRRSGVRFADTGRDKDIQRNDDKATFISSAPGFPNRMDNPLRADGHRDCKGVSCHSVKEPHEKPLAVSCPTGFQLFMELYFLQFSVIRHSFFLAVGAAGAGLLDDFILPQG